MNDVLLVRLDKLGDAIACVPLLEGLARKYPAARFHAVCSPRNMGVFSPGRVRTLNAVAGDFRSRLASARYDAAIVATDEVAGFAIARASGAARRVGFWHGFEKPFKSLWQRMQLTDAVYRPATGRRAEHEVEALYRLAAALGASLPAPSDPRVLREWLALERPADGELAGALGIQVTAKLASGGWGPSGLSRYFASALRAASLQRCVVLCAPADEMLARAMLERLETSPSGTPRVALLVSASLSHWLGAIEGLSALVSPDSGAAHAAGMLGVPVVDLFDGDRFELTARRWRPWAAPFRCLAKPPWQPGTEAALGAEVGAAIREVVAMRDPTGGGTSQSSILIS